MTYYYAISQDDYNGIMKIGSSSTLQNALKNLRIALRDNIAAVQGYIFDTAKIPEYYPSRTPKNLVGTMYESRDYIWIRKGLRKKYKVLSDGRLIPYTKG